MRFPEQWDTLGMYPDSLFRWQLSGYKSGHENGAEHERNAAFNCGLRQKPSHAQLENLLRLAAADPDPSLGDDLRKYIREAAMFNEQLRLLDEQLFAQQ